MYKQAADISIAALADAQQTILATGAVLSWREPQRRGHLPAIGEMLGITNRGDQRRSD